MPANFPEIWLNRVIQHLDNTDEAPFLEGISELDVDVTQINEGSMSEKQKIYVPTTEFEVDVLVNNNTYPLELQPYEDGTIELNLDKYQTKVMTLTDDQTIGASYKKIDVVTKSGRRGILIKKYKKAIHSIAPLKDTEDTPVMEVTGGKEGLTDATGRKRLTYEDLVAFKQKCEDAGFDDMPRLVLCNKHWNDLLLDRKNFGNQLVDYKKGTPAPVIAGFELQQYKANPVYSASKEKKPFDAIKEETDKEASVCFNKTAIAKKTGITKQYFAAAAQNPRSQSNELAYRHYFVVMPFQNKKIGALI